MFTSKDMFEEMQSNYFQEYMRRNFGITGMAANIIEERENSQMHAIKIEKVIKNDDAVIVLWTDKTKTVVKLMAGDTDDIYSAVGQAIAKKIYGGTGKFHSHVNKVLKDYTTPMISIKNPTIIGFKNFFDGIWNLSHPKGTDRDSVDSFHKEERDPCKDCEAYGLCPTLCEHLGSESWKKRNLKKS